MRNLKLCHWWKHYGLSPFILVERTNVPNIFDWQFDTSCRAKDSGNSSKNYNNNTFEINLNLKLKVNFELPYHLTIKFSYIKGIR